jgi:hypothetical protein
MRENTGPRRTVVEQALCDLRERDSTGQYVPNLPVWMTTRTRPSLPARPVS